MPDFRLFQYLVKGEKEFRLQFQKLGAGLKDFRFLWPSFAQKFYEIEQEQFGSEGRKNKWAALSPAYAKWKAAHFPGKSILQRQGPLVTSLTRKGAAGSVYEEKPLSLTLGSSIGYAGAHQKGRGRMPARPPIDITPNDVKAFGKIAQQGLEQIASKAGFRSTGLAA